MKKLVIILIILGVLGCAGYLAYDKITDFMVKKTLNMVMEDEKLKAEIDAVLEGIVPQLPADSADAPGGEEGTPDSSSDLNTPADGHSVSVLPTANPHASARPRASAHPQSSAPAKNDGELTIDDLQGADKTYVMGIYKRFSASEVSKVSGMLSGGLTAEEKKAIKAIVYAKVSSTEINKLFQIAKKYQYK